MAKLQFRLPWAKKNPASGTAYVRVLLLELLIVFSGVSLAFMLNDYSERQKLAGQKTKVLVSLKKELELVRIQFPGQSDYQQSKLKEWLHEAKSGDFAGFSNWRYIQPQHNYTVLEFAINSREAGVVDFGILQCLLKAHQDLKKLEYTEEKITTLALRYRPLPKPADSLLFAYRQQEETNRFLFNRFRSYSMDRAYLLSNSASLAAGALALINAQLPAKTIAAIEIEIMAELLAGMDGMAFDQHLGFIKKSFPAMSQKDIEKVFSLLKKENP